MAALTWPAKGKPRTLVYKAAGLLNDWTVILDPEMLLATNVKACAAVSQMLNSKLFGMLCEGTSGTYAYVYCDGEIKRSFFAVDRQIYNDIGEHIPGEPPAEEVDEVSILQMMARMGVDYQALASVADFYVFEFDESGLVMSPDAPKPEVEPVAKKKPWWRVW